MLDGSQVRDRARRIRLAVFDVDGVFTDGTLYYTDNAAELRAFHVHDGLGVKLLVNAGVEVAVVSARESALVLYRMRELGVKTVRQGCDDKLSAFEELRSRGGFEYADMAYTGDDLPDLAPMRAAGLAIAVANARAEVQAAAHWQTHSPGGQGAVRDVCDLLLKARGRFDEYLKANQTTPA